MTDYTKVNFFGREPVSYEKLQQLNENIDYIRNIMDTADKGIIAYESMNTGEVTNTLSTYKNLKRITGVTTESGRHYKLSAYIPKVYNEGTKESGYAGASVAFILKVNQSTIVKKAFANPGPRYKWCDFYIEHFFSPGATTQSYQIDFAPLFGVGVAKIVTNAANLRGYLKVEDKGPGR